MLRPPARSTLITAPPSSPSVGWWRNATRSPSGDTRTWLTQPAVSNSTLPIGYSTRHLPSTRRMTARLAPSGPQSAHCTSSRISRGAPPRSGAWASVPLQTKRPAQWRSSESAIWPVARDREDLGLRQREGARLRALGARREEPARLALPGRAVDHGLAVGGEARGEDRPAPERQALEGREAAARRRPRRPRPSRPSRSPRGSRRRSISSSRARSFVEA